MNGPVGIKLIAYGSEVIEPNEWVVSFDPDVSATDPPTFPTGSCESDPDPAKALRFPAFIDAAEFWKTQSTAVPFRPDGEPNRPLTAFMVAIEPLP